MPTPLLPVSFVSSDASLNIIRGSFSLALGEIQGPGIAAASYRCQGSILVPPEFVFYVRCELPDAIYNDPQPSLREYALISLHRDRGIIRIPSRTNCSRSECRRKWHDIWSNRLFTAS